MRVSRGRWLWWPIGTIAALAGAIVVAVNATPYPGAMFIRFVFEWGARSTKKRNASRGSPDAVVTVSDVEYLAAGSREDRGDGDTTLDVYLPAGVADDEVLPALVWIHGGGWVSGDKTNTDFYFQRLAANGFAVVALNYSKAPERRYPTAIAQTNAAVGFLADQGRRYHVDGTRLVLAGDSAGAQIASQLAALIADPTLAQQSGVTPAVSADRIRGVVLNCGVYDVRALRSSTATSLVSRVLSWCVGNTLWAYGGKRSGNRAMLDEMSTIDLVTSAFPEVWISGGNADPLTAKQTIPFIAKLNSVGVPAETLVYGADAPERLHHEYQFELGTPQGQEALRQTAAFVHRVTA